MNITISYSVYTMSSILKKIFLTFVLLSLFAPFEVRAEKIGGYEAQCLDGVRDLPNEHSANLVINPNHKPKPDKKTWVYVCITEIGGPNTVENTLPGTVCSTGKEDLDMALFGTTEGLTLLRKRTGKIYPSGLPAFDGTVGGIIGGQGCPSAGCRNNPGPNPATTNSTATGFKEGYDASGKLVWVDYYESGSPNHQFFWVQEDEATATGGNGAGSDAGIKQGTFDWAQALTEKNSDCARVAWDPTGYIFDAKTLLPVKDIRVLLTTGQPGGVFTKVPVDFGIINPQSTQKLNGQYSFYVPPGFYKIELPPESLSSAQPAPMADINPAYRSLFSDKNGNANVFPFGTEVEEKRGLVAIAHTPVTILNLGLLIKNLQVAPIATTRSNESIHIVGSVSHPKSTIIETMTFLPVDGGSARQIVKKDVTDDLGRYDKYISQEYTDPTDGKNLILQNLAVSFELNSFYTGGAVQTPSKSVDIKPMPAYIEGIAYDERGTPIPMGIVGVYPFFSSKAMYTTVADENGRFKIGSQHLPQVQYKLRYKKATGEVLVVGTEQFIKQNITLISQEKIEPFSSKNTTAEEDRVVQEYFAGTNISTDLKTPEEVQKERNRRSGQNISNTTSSRTTPQNLLQASKGILGSGSQGVGIIIVVLIVLLTLGAGAFIMMKSKQTPQI